MAKIFFLILTATLISIATADGESSSEYNSTESQDILDETLTHLPESTPDNLDTASSATDSIGTDSTLNPVPDSSTESLTDPTSWSTSETPELSTHLAESTPNTTPTDDSTTPRLTTESSTPLPTQDITNTTPHLTEENHEHSTHSPQSTPSSTMYTEASSTTTSGYTTTPRLTTQSSTSPPTQDVTNTTPHLTEENHEHSTHSPQSTPSSTMYTEASSTTTSGYTTSSSTAATESPATTGLPSTGSTESTTAADPYTRENVLRKKTELATMYRKAINELVAEQKLMNQTYEKLFVANFKLHEGDKAVRTVSSNLWYGWDNKMIMAHVIQCAKAKNNVFVESVEQLENCRNTLPGNVATTKKEILHVYATALNVINDAMYMENICEPKDCAKLYYETNVKLVDEVIPSAMRDIQTLRRRVSNVRSHMELCYENIELEHRPSETLNKHSITNCALWSIRKDRILCKVSLTNCAFSKWIISVLPWNIE